MAEQAVYFNPWDPQFCANPYPHYPALLAGPPPLLYFGSSQVALLARYEHCAAALRDHERFSNVEPAPVADAYKGPFYPERDLLGQDPPEHTRLRRLISRDFTPRRIRELEPRIREIARQILDRASARGEFDVVADLGNVLPVMVIAEMLGIPPEQYETFKNWSDAVIQASFIPGTVDPSEAAATKGLAAVESLAEYFRAEVAKRRKHPGSDLVSALVAARDQADALSEKALIQFIVLLLLAGNETTTNLIGNGMLALMRNPDQLDLLHREPGLIANAIEEMLRYDGPVQSTMRYAKVQVEVGGTELAGGMMAFIVLAAANRDPAQFPNPERFDITRTPIEHLAFGEGIHFCIGAPLARLEGAIAIGEMLRRFPKLRMKNPAAALEYKGSYFLRGLAALPMALE